MILPSITIKKIVECRVIIDIKSAKKRTFLKCSLQVPRETNSLLDIEVNYQKTEKLCN